MWLILKPFPKDPHLFMKANIRPNSLELQLAAFTAGTRPGVPWPHCPRRPQKASPRTGTGSQPPAPGSRPTDSHLLLSWAQPSRFLFSLFLSLFQVTFFQWEPRTAENPCRHPRSFKVLNSPVATIGFQNRRRAPSALTPRARRV